jgi:oligosaccharide 4-alpha-D-glucosyltransferase
MNMPKSKRSTNVLRFLLLLLFSTIFIAAAPAALYQSHQVSEDGLLLNTDQGPLQLRFLTAQAVEVAWEPVGLRQLPSFSIDPTAHALRAELVEFKDHLRYQTADLSVTIEKSPVRLSYFNRTRDGHIDKSPLLREEAGLIAHDSLRGFRFMLSDEEKLIGGGQRIFGKMNRRGQRLPLYNKAHYGYETQSKQMYFSLPAVLSTRGYLLLFDNSARGTMDLGKTQTDVMSFTANGGRTAYLVVNGKDTPDIIDHYTRVTGRQPLPARWTLGSFASRFGYRTQAEVENVVALYRQLQFPLDALVLDLYWFGPDIKGHMGNLSWDLKAFPDPAGMLKRLRQAGVRSILVTEPFILTTSKRWNEAVAAGAITKDLANRPKTFDFYFGNTGLIDVFHPPAMDWFYGIYRELMDQGVNGWWGDLGEPEVHPKDAIHAIGAADSVHNAYGHQWAAGLYDRLLQDRPDERPFIMMRAGAAGSQRYGMVPWTGDVARSWGGLKPQVELALQMGQLGMGWTHSDLGGFAGGKRFDRELYVRWLQYGVFQPVFRPHAQDNIAAEPVFHDRKTQALLKPYLDLRYRLLPYNYTLAWENSSNGMPLMRPLSFLDSADPTLYERTDAYMWGAAFLVRPITAAGQKRVELSLPEGIWFDYWTDARKVGGRPLSIKPKLQELPVYVRAGSFVPMLPHAIQTTRDYDSSRLQLHYWHDSSVTRAHGQMYDDDGQSRAAITADAFEVLDFHAQNDAQQMSFQFERTGANYKGRPKRRELQLVVHNWTQSSPTITVKDAGHTRQLGDTEHVLDRQARTLTVRLRFGDAPLAVRMRF